MKRKLSLLFIITGIILFSLSIILKVISGNFDNIIMMLIYLFIFVLLAMYMIYKYITPSNVFMTDIDEEEYEKLLKQYEEKYKNMD